MQIYFLYILILIYSISTVIPAEETHILKHNSEELLQIITAHQPHKIINTIKSLIQNEADCLLLYNNKPLLVWACEWNDTEFIDYLLKHGAFVNHVLNKNFSLLHFYAANATPNQLQLLLEYGANPLQKDCYNQSPTTLAKNTAIQKLLYLYGAPVEDYYPDHSEDEEDIHFFMNSLTTQTSLPMPDTLSPTMKTTALVCFAYNHQHDLHYRPFAQLLKTLFSFKNIKNMCSYYAMLEKRLRNVIPHATTRLQFIHVLSHPINYLGYMLYTTKKLYNCTIITHTV